MSKPQSKNRPLTTEEKSAMGDAAELIRRHLWLGPTAPPPPNPKDPRPWSMARDLSIWKRLLFNGRDPEEINGAIAHVRKVLPNQADIPLRLTVFYSGTGNATPIFEQARAFYIRSLDDVPHGRRVKLPPTVAKVLRGMMDG